MKTDTICGCNTCLCIVGGYQVHLTLHKPSQDVLELLDTEGIELITITNYKIFKGTYVEHITTKNYKKLEEALLAMCVLAEKIKTVGGNILRSKIESNPKNNHKYLYKEVHYKIGQDDMKLLRDKCFFSKNAKGTLFATQRFFEGDEVVFLDYPKVVEDVIYDSNLDLDKGISRDIYRAIPAAKLGPMV